MACRCKLVARVLVVLATVTAGLALQPSAGWAVPPANDLIENATVIDVLPFSATQSTQDATQSASDPPASCIGGTFGTVWFRYDAPCGPAAAANDDHRQRLRFDRSSIRVRRGR